jgi:hypothetical protein
MTRQWQSGCDEHSIEADARFVDAAAGDYRVRGNSPALRLGFQNFPMDQFGVQSPKRKSIARTPELPRTGTVLPATLQSGRDTSIAAWLGASVKNIVGMGEVSASGLPGEIGVLLLDVQPDTRAASAGLRKGDVVLQLGGNRTDALQDLRRLSAESPAFGTVRITIWRSQRELTRTTAAHRALSAGIGSGNSRLDRCRRCPRRTRPPGTGFGETGDIHMRDVFILADQATRTHSTIGPGGRGLRAYTSAAPDSPRGGPW